MPDEPQQRANVIVATMQGVPSAADGIRGSDASGGALATKSLTTKVDVPDAANMHEIGGQAPNASHSCIAPAQQEASVQVYAHAALLPAAANEIGGLVRSDYLALPASSEDRARDGMSAFPPMPDPANIAALSELQRQRRFCIKSQSRIDRACEAFIARYLGYRLDMPKPEGLAIWKQAAALRKAVEKGDEGQNAVDDRVQDALVACAPIILNSAASRKAWDAHRNQTEKAMRKLARSLHAWAWVEGVAGFGDLGLGIIVGETGDLTNYATKERVWKRLGLAVIEGERQQRKAGAEAAAAHGYNPQRRAEVWTIADSLFKHQWRGAKDDAPAQAAGPYGRVYAARKVHTVTREWTPKHQDNDARRVMTKALVEDLWRVWRGLPPLCQAPPCAGDI